MKDCENIIREENTINPNDSLIIFKVEKESNNVKEKSVQYEVYHPDTKNKIDLSKCNSIDLNIPITLDAHNEFLYKDLQEQGYDLFDINDKFYQDICSNYKSENSTDVLLSDRQKDFFNNNLTCQNNCKYSNYSMKTQNLICECEIEKNNITLDKFKDIFVESFSSLTKNTNYKFLKCYKSVFSVKSFYKNYGSIILIILFLVHLSILIIYIIKGLNPLKLDIIRMIENMKKTKESKKRKRIKRKSQEVTSGNPPKKGTRISAFNIQPLYERRINIKSKTIINTKNITNKQFFEGRKTASGLKIKEQLGKLKEEFNFELGNDININALDEYEINNLKYKDALKFDKRTWTQIYCSMIKKKHLILFAFFTPNDFNLIYFKFSKIVFLLATNFALNILFFFDESIHKIYINSGFFNLVQQLPQIIYSSLILIFFEFIIEFLTLSEGDIHEIKSFIKKQKSDYLEEIDKILNCFKIKFICFFVFSFTMLVFFWYFISAFCSVYENTQIIFIGDSFSSFTVNLMNSCIKYIVFTTCRVISLRCNKGYFICEILYKLGVF